MRVAFYLNVIAILVFIMVDDILARRRRNEKGPAVVCRQPADRGYCHGYFKRWYHDIAKRECVQFTYSGCYGNENNFHSKMKCEEFCSGRRSNPMCDSEKDPGPCYSSIPSWYFDKKSRTCRKFIYGGCKGNKNRYTSLTKCERTCKMTDVMLMRQKDQEETCTVSPDPGPCSSHYRRWYYDPAQGRCRIFIYGGCRGNMNRFIKPKECEATCAGVGQYIKSGQCPAVKAMYADECTDTCARDNDCPGEEKCCANGCGKHCSYAIHEYPTIEPSCLVKADAGPCRAHFERWYYDVDAQQCKPFVYGGCLGNANRYPTKVSCIRGCKASEGVQTFCSKGNGKHQQDTISEPASYENHTLIVTTIQQEPYVMLKKEHPGIKFEGNARFEGFIVDMLEYVAAKMHINYHVKLVNDGKYGSPDVNSGRWNGMVGEIQKYKADIAAAPLTVTYDREKVVDFTHPFATESLDVLVDKDTLESELELATDTDSLVESDVRVGIVRDSFTTSYLKNSPTVEHQYLWAKVDSEPKETLLSSSLEGIQRVEKGKFAFILDSSVTEFVVRNNCNLTTLGRPFGSFYFSFAVRKHSPLRDPLSHEIMQMRENGELESIHEKWWQGKCH